jgi:hypothetical protein
MDLERRMGLVGRPLGLSSASRRDLDSRRLGQGSARLVSVAGTLAVSCFIQIDFARAFYFARAFLFFVAEKN